MILLTVSPQLDAELPARVRNAIARSEELKGITYNLLSLMPERKVRAVKGIGARGLDHLRAALRARGLVPFQGPQHVDSADRMRARAAKVARDHGREDIARAIEEIIL